MFRQSTPETFWKKVDQRGGPDACWPFTGLLEGGYGRITYQRKVFLTHRLASILTSGPIPDGIQVRHKCDNPPCCNPAHLERGTVLDNMRDRKVRKRHWKDRGTYKIPCGEKNVKSHLTDAIVLEMKKAMAAGETSKSVADRFGTTQKNIYHIRHGYSWRHIVVEGLPTAESPSS